jgi:hypothetical protein
MMIDKDNNSGSPVASSTATHAADMRETAEVLELAIAQIGLSLHDSDRAVESLIAAITAMAGCVGRIEDKLDAARGSSNSNTTEDAIHKECERAKNQMQQAVTAFQFYDLLSQRFLHIESNLKAVADVMRAPDQQHPAMWQQLRDKLRSVYSLEQEQVMYQALLAGLSAESVIVQADAETEKSCGDIELF